MAQERDQEHTGCKQPEAPLLCANNCGFFGCPATMNLCSKCYGELRLKEESRVSVKAFGEKNPIILSAIAEKTLSKGGLSACMPTTGGPQEGDLVSVSSIQSSTEHLPSKADTPSVSGANILKPSEPTEGTIKTKLESVSTLTQSTPLVAQVQSSGSTRCISCRKRVGLLGFKCRCGGVFCALHRYSDKHGCSFDYKTVGRDAIAKANPVIKADKVEKI